MTKKANTETSAFQNGTNFETSLNELETLIEKMETGQLTLEESLKNFEAGISLARQCQQALKEAEQKVQILIEKNGIVQATPFSAETLIIEE